MFYPTHSKSWIYHRKINTWMCAQFPCIRKRLWNMCSSAVQKVRSLLAIGSLGAHRGPNERRYRSTECGLCWVCLLVWILTMKYSWFWMKWYRATSNSQNRRDNKFLPNFQTISACLLCCYSGMKMLTRYFVSIDKNTIISSQRLLSIFRRENCSIHMITEKKLFHDFHPYNSFYLMTKLSHSFRSSRDHDIKLAEINLPHRESQYRSCRKHARFIEYHLRLIMDQW